MQSEHADYPDLLFPCFSGLLSFDDSTKLHIREGNRVREIRILAGECIIFTGEVMHFGASYKKDNRRIFFKAIPSDKTLPGQVYKDVAIKQFKCPYCPESYGERHLLQYHKNICIYGNTVDEISAFRGRQAAKTNRTRKSNN
jgi:hypothetical protein